MTILRQAAIGVLLIEEERSTARAAISGASTGGLIGAAVGSGAGLAKRPLQNRQHRRAKKELKVRHKKRLKQNSFAPLTKERHRSKVVWQKSVDRLNQRHAKRPGTVANVKRGFRRGTLAGAGIGATLYALGNRS